MDWIFNKYSLEHKDDVKCLLMKSLIETLKMDSEMSKLKDLSVVSNVSPSLTPPYRFLKPRKRKIDAVLKPQTLLCVRSSTRNQGSWQK